MPSSGMETNDLRGSGVCASGEGEAEGVGVGVGVEVALGDGVGVGVGVVADGVRLSAGADDRGSGAAHPAVATTTVAARRSADLAAMTSTVRRRWERRPTVDRAGWGHGIRGSGGQV